MKVVKSLITLFYFYLMTFQLPYDWSSSNSMTSQLVLRYMFSKYQPYQVIESDEDQPYDGRNVTK